MVAFYIKRIGEGKMELKQVPSKWYTAVETGLNKER